MGKTNRVKGGQGRVKGEHPGTKNLIPLNKRSPADRKRIQALGGKASAKTRSLTMKLRYLLEKGMTDETAAKLYEIMTDGTLSSLDVRLYIEKAKKNLKTSDEKMKMSKLLLDWHKSRHGEKQQKQEIEHFGAEGIKVVFVQPDNLIRE